MSNHSSAWFHVSRTTSSPSSPSPMSTTSPPPHPTTLRAIPYHLACVSSLLFCKDVHTPHQEPGDRPTTFRVSCFRTCPVRLEASHLSMYVGMMASHPIQCSHWWAKEKASTVVVCMELHIPPSIDMVLPLGLPLPSLTFLIRASGLSTFLLQSSFALFHESRLGPTGAFQIYASSYFRPFLVGVCPHDLHAACSGSSH